ncbi:MAG: hypothetical protein PHV11_10045, partial [Candidatus Bipolaricaulis sp.]|nr:hypothetical protein [Candidatus Bipolaricaulis sp.]
MKYYKLTDQDKKTHGDTEWGEHVTHKATGKGKELCTEDVIHVYDHPLKAAMFNPIHAYISNPKLWECRVRRVVANDKLKVGVKICTTIKEISLPEITTNQRVRFAILCALKAYPEPSFVEWANNWLSGKDRSQAAEAAAWAAEAAAWAAAGAAEAAAWAAWAAE